MSAFIKGLGFSLLAALSAPFPLFAHLEPGSLSSPKAGGSYGVGDKINITWGQQQFHSGKYLLDYSKDAGVTWASIASWTGPSGDDVSVNYSWTIPNAPTTKAKVRVCQISNCLEPEYLLVSGNFTIGAGSPILPSDAPAETSLRFRPDTRTLEAAFSLGRGEAVTLRAFDAGGRLVATLLDGGHAAGAHRYSLSSPRIAGAGALLFSLEIGGRTVAESWTARP